MCDGDYFVMYPLLNFQPVKGFKCMSNVGMFRGAGDCAGKCILNLLKAFNLYERKSVIKRITIVKTRVDQGSGDSDSSGKVKSGTDATEATNVVIAGARKRRNLLAKDNLESKMNPRFLAEEV